jgi:hypothetical protein
MTGTSENDVAATALDRQPVPTSSACQLASRNGMLIIDCRAIIDSRPR